LIDECYLHVMKRYEYKIIAALVTIIFSMCCPKTALGAPYPPPQGRRGSQNRKVNQNYHTCIDSKSYYFRSQCSDNGVLTVVNRQVLVQTTGLDVHHTDAEFVVETCHSSSRLGSFPPSSSSNSSSPIVRYRHKKSNKYICFSKKGKVRTVSKKQVDKRGMLCMFNQQPVDDSENLVDSNTYHRLQSRHNRRWFLGFDHRSSSLSLIKGREPHRGALPRRGKFFNPKKCDFKFFAGEHRTVELWEGLFGLIDRNKVVSKAVDLNNVEVSTNELRDDFNNSVVKHSEPRKISAAHKEALQQQQVLKKKTRKYRNRIRHAKHKQPRLNRQSKNKLRRKKKPISRKKKPISKNKRTISKS